MRFGDYRVQGLEGLGFKVSWGQTKTSGGYQGKLGPVQQCFLAVTKSSTTLERIARRDQWPFEL